jgi:hypothetical protein
MENSKWEEKHWEVSKATYGCKGLERACEQKSMQHSLTRCHALGSNVEAKSPR